jgi:8-oxo-dGTP pyrophosphatase MutT (NUDIX family)
MKKWKLLKSDKVLSSDWITVSKNQYKLNGGRVINDYYIVSKADFVLIIAHTKNKLILGKQYRPATDKFYLSVPAGNISPNENPLEAARRELLEETGYTAKSCQIIGRLDTLPGYIKSRAFVVLCEVDESHKEEFQEIVKLDWDKVVKLITKGKIDETQTVSALLLAKEWTKH